MKQCAVFASGCGSNLQAIISAVKKRKIPARLALVVSDNPNAYALKRAKKAKIPSVVVDPKKFRSRASFDRAVMRHLKDARIDFIVLAGFMRIISPRIVRKYKNRILNIHPALLPAFKGAHAIDDAHAYGVRVSGVTVHFVDEKIDHGPVILQEPVAITARDTRASLERKIHRVEHTLYPRAIRLFVLGKLKVTGRRVRII